MRVVFFGLGFVFWRWRGGWGEVGGGEEDLAIDSICFESREPESKFVGVATCLFFTLLHPSHGSTQFRLPSLVCTPCGLGGFPEV